MREEDLPEVLSIENSSFPNPWRDLTFLGEIRNQSISFPLVVVHSLHKRVIGYIIFWKIFEDVQINNIAVHPDYRRLGIGRAVLEGIKACLNTLKRPKSSPKESKARFCSVKSKNAVSVPT